MRANTNISLKERRTLTLSDFRGVDLTTSPLRVASNRATYMRNLINDHGVNHKRPGWREMLKIEDEKINGIFPYQNGNHDVLLVHAGDSFYVASYNANTEMLSVGDSVMSGLDNTRSQCVYRGGFAYILGCGDFLAYGKHGDGACSLKSVSEIAYVPTTTINISKVKEGVADIRGTLENVNLLTPKRINTLVGSTDTDSWWILDGIPDVGSEVVIDAEIKLDGETAYGTYQFKGTVNDDGSATISYDNYTYSFVFGNGKLSYSSSTAPKVDGAANITVTFSCTTEGYADRIQKAKFGALFGVDGASDRLFVGGNPDHPDMDFWSEANDFTYFPDGNTMQIGGDQRQMTGYARLSDSTLAIFKESLVGEPSIYYRTGAKTTMTDADGDTIPAVYFPVVAGTAGEGSVAHHAVANLAGDVLILSRDGVRAIELSSNVASGERYTRDRGRAIYEDLRKKNLDEAVATVWRGRYFLACGDGVCYVADSRYRATFEGSPDTQYEWWVWDNVPARVFAVHEDTLWFGTESGMICAFEEGTFADIECIALESGDLLCDDCGKLNYNNNLDLKQGDRVVLKGGAYALLANDIKVENGVCKGDLTGLRDDQEVYADTVGESGLVPDTPYMVDLDVVAETFTLTTKNGEAVTPAADGFRLLASLDGVELYVANAADLATLAWGYSLVEKGNTVWNEIVLAQYNTEGAANWTGRYMCAHPVVAEWYSPVMDMGTNLYAKSLLGFTVAGEPGICGRVTFGYETRRREEHQYIAVRGEGSSFSFDDVDFNDFTFDKAFATSYSRSMNVRNFNFIACRWRSDEECDSAVSGVTLTYKVNRKNKGVR